MAVLLLLALAALLAAMWLLSRYRRATAARRNHMLRGILLYGIGLAILGLVLSGRIHALFAIISAAVPWINRAFTARQAWTMFRNFKNRGAAGGRRPAPDEMDAAVAREILGVARGATRQEIIAAHRGLMNKIHPDRGGSNYLAARINRAKEILLQEI